MSKPIFNEPILSVLMYHSVSNNGWEFSTTPDDFEKQIKYLLENNYSFMTPEDIPDFLNKSKLLKKNSVLITFDDGYNDFYENALPILKKFNVPAALFVHTNRLSNNLGNDYELMDWQTLSGLGEYNIGVYSHSHTHPILREMDADKLREDLNQAEDLLNRYIKTDKFIAYPGGKYSGDVMNLLFGLGYKAAFTISRGLVNPGDNHLEIKRNGVQKNTSFLEFKVRTTRANSWYEFLRS